MRTLKSNKVIYFYLLRNVIKVGSNDRMIEVVATYIMIQL